MKVDDGTGEYDIFIKNGKPAVRAKLAPFYTFFTLCPLAGNAYTDNGLLAIEFARVECPLVSQTTLKVK